jgi:hypothetical protein
VPNSRDRGPPRGLGRRPVAQSRVTLGLALATVLLLALAPRMMGIGELDPVAGEGALWRQGQQTWDSLRERPFDPGRWQALPSGAPLPRWVFGWAPSLPAARWVAVALGVAGCLALFWVATRLGGARVGLLAAGLLALLPPAVGHRRLGSEGLDLLLATVAVGLACTALHTDRGADRARLLFGLVAGLALSSRGDAIWLIGMLFILYISARAGHLWRRRVIELPLTLLGAPLLAAAVLVASDPAAWYAPLQRTLANLTARWPAGGAPGLEHAGWWEASAGFASQLPLGVILLAILGLVRAVSRPTWQRAAVALWLVVPLAATLLTRPSDGGRSLAAAFGPVVILAAEGALALGAALHEVIARRFGAVGGEVAPAFLAALLLGYLAIATLGFGSDQVAYVGEIPLAAGRSLVCQPFVQRQQRGSGMGRAARFVNRTAEPGAAVRVRTRYSELVALRSDLERGDEKRPAYLIDDGCSGPQTCPHGHRRAFVVQRGKALLARVCRPSQPAPGML